MTNQLMKPTSEEKRIIRECAQRGAKMKRVEICPSTRVNMNDQRTHMNIVFVSDDPDWNDTDLADNAFKWSDFTRGVELQDGRGAFDFWVYSTGRDPELQTNVTAYYECGRLVRVDEVEAGTMWKAPTEAGPCRMFLLCDNPATTTRPHSILGAVPCCERCATKMDRINQK